MIVDLATYTAIHTALSVIALLAGALVLYRVLQGDGPGQWNTPFLATAVATSVTGFGFPFVRFLPSHGVGIVALVVLAAALVVRHSAQQTTLRARIFALCLVASEYLLVFVAIAQAFTKVPGLRAAAPTLSEAPFVVAQCLALAGFVALGIAVWRSNERRIDAGVKA